jgi:hypothetical protein
MPIEPDDSPYVYAEVELARLDARRAELIARIEARRKADNH